MCCRSIGMMVLVGLSSVAMSADAPNTHVDPFVGTDDMGHTFPGATAPFGFVQLSPQTDLVPYSFGDGYNPETYRYCSGYQYGDGTIVGFAHTHFSGTGHSDLGDVLVMPTVGALQLDPGTSEKPESGYRSRFSHEREFAEPGAYSVTLDDHGIEVELTATERVGVHRYTFPASEAAQLILDLTANIYDYPGKTVWSSVRMENDQLLTGYRQTSGWARSRVLYFAIEFSKRVKSYGLRNEEEQVYRDFWRRFDQDRDFPERVGRRVKCHFDWETAEGEQIVHGVLPVWSHHGNENWCMIGYHAVPVIADAYLKGLRGFDVDRALEAMVASATFDRYDGIGDYRKLGWVPADRHSNAASKTLEYAYDDWTIARMAEVMGKTEIAAEFDRRAASWRKLHDPDTGFLRARNADGGFPSDFDPMATHGQGYVEGNAWNYSLYVPHDIAGFIDLLGGDGMLVSWLDHLFEMKLDDESIAHNEDITRAGIIGNYVHGNEPSHHVPYLYCFAGQPWKTQARVRQIMTEMYRPAPDGLGGNDDLGQMSAWYVFSALGFYPVAPGSNQYVLGSPSVRRAEIDVGGGRSFIVIAENQEPGNVYVESVRLNGDALHRCYITHEEIVAGGELHFVMSDGPNRGWATEIEQRSYSVSR